MLHFRVQGPRILLFQALPKVFSRMKLFQLLLHVQVLPKVLLRMDLFSLLLHIQVLPKLPLCMELFHFYYLYTSYHKHQSVSTERSTISISEATEGSTNKNNMSMMNKRDGINFFFVRLFLLIFNF